MEANTVDQSKALKGGAFLIKNESIDHLFIPEQMNEEQKMVKETALSFVEQEIVPNIKRIEKQEEGLAEALFKKCGELGFLGAHMPEQYGGMNLDFNTNTVLSDGLGAMGSFNTSFAAHTGIGMLPIFYFGTEAQKEKYLPSLITGEKLAAYCLTEPSSGSDALAAKTRADLTDDGRHYLLNGQKMWISNAGFADVFVVFAKIDGDKFTGFIVERGTEGLTFGEEEDKLGIKGSSTRQVFFENMKIPVENVLGEIGKGHLIAFNVLNMGRYKLAAFCMGGCKAVSTKSVQYANERHQFKVPIASFGAIKFKLAEQAIRILALESAIYRMSNQIQLKIDELKEEGKNFAEAKLVAAEEYAIECSIAKVVGSEVLDYVVDEYVQIMGGIGFSEEHDAARSYRDARINRIYEGTNEINRLVIIDMLLKRSMKGHIDLVGAAWNVQKELAKMPSLNGTSGRYGKEAKAINDLKKMTLMVIGAAGKKQMDGEINLKHEQEIIMNASNMIIDVYLAESLLLRIKKLDEVHGEEAASRLMPMLEVFLWDASQRMSKEGRDAIASFASGDLLTTFLLGIKRFDTYKPVNVKEKRREIAERLISANEYCF